MTLLSTRALLPGLAPTADAAHAAAAAPPAQAAPGVDVSALFVEHAPFLTRVVIRLAGPGAHVDDILQETFLAAHRRRAELRPATVRAWLYRVAANHVLHHRRSFARLFRLRGAVAEHEPCASLARDVGGSPHDSAEQRERIAAVHRCARSLPFALREVFVLFELEGMTGRDIAALVGVEEGTVWSRLSNARRAFKVAWQREGR